MDRKFSKIVKEFVIAREPVQYTGSRLREGRPKQSLSWEIASSAAFGSLFAMTCAFIIVFVSGCATVYNPATGKQEMQFVTTAQEIQIGRDISRQIERRFKVLHNPALEGRVNFIGLRLAAVSDRKDLAHQFKIIDEDSINAFTVLGGYIYVHKGLLDFVRSDSELASVLAHELGHSAARHSAKRLEAEMGYQLLTSLIFREEKYADLQRAVGISVDLIVLGYGRKDELAADRLGVKYMMMAGYNPEAAVDVLKRLQQKEGSGHQGIGIFLSTHPLIPERIMTVRQEISWLKAQKGLQ